MNLVKLVWSYLLAKRLTTILNIFLLSLGVAVITVLILFSKQLEENIQTNARSIDLVVGAKGSPLQLILCSIFHIDFPTGNIFLRDAEKLAHHPLVRNAVPLSMGDNYKGYRIVGTNLSYPKLYEATLSEGKWFQEEMEAVIGATVADLVGLAIGDTFPSSHGLSSDGHHHDQNFKVIGIMRRNHNVMDNLILTPIESVWHVHEHTDGDEDDEDHHQGKPTVNPYTLVPTLDKSDTTKEITSLLLQFRNPMGFLQLPRYINSQTNMQAASPSFETARLFSILGVGVEVLNGFAYVIVLISMLSIFIALYNSLKERQYDLAIMRSMGAGKKKLLASVLLEGCSLTIAGSVLGFFLGHLLLLIFVLSFSEAQQLDINPYRLYSEEGWLFMANCFLGIVCSVIPAFESYKMNIHNVLAGKN